MQTRQPSDLRDSEGDDPEGLTARALQGPDGGRDSDIGIFGFPGSVCARACMLAYFIV